MTLKISGITNLNDYVGKHLGYSSWRTITQDIINKFADVTDDHQWIHVDTAQAKLGPFGTTIAHGYLTLSLIPSLLPEIVEITDIGMAVNYGANKVRFPSPVPSNSDIRLGATLGKIDEFSGGIQITLEVMIETRNATKPSLVAELLYRYYA